MKIRKKYALYTLVAVPMLCILLCLSLATTNAEKVAETGKLDKIDTTKMPVDYSLAKGEVVDDASKLSYQTDENWSYRKTEGTLIGKNRFISRIDFVDEGESQNVGSIEIYTWQKNSAQNIVQWIKQNDAHWFDSTYDSLIENATISGFPGMIIQLCTDPVSIFGYIDRGDVITRITISGSEVDKWKKAIEKIEIVGKTKFKDSYPSQPIVVETQACKLVSDVPVATGLADPMDCNYQNPADNDCCAQYEDSSNLIKRWQCAAGISNNGEYGNCVYWAAHERRDIGNAVNSQAGSKSGSAMYWNDYADDAGYTVDDCPRVGDIYVSENNHVANVFAVDHFDQPKVDWTEMNWCENGCVKTIIGTFSTPYPSKSYIHTDQQEIIFYWNVHDDADPFNNNGLCGGRETVWTTEVGNKTIAGNDALGWFNDKASAIYVPEGRSVKVYSNDNQTGSSKCFAPTTANQTNFTLDTYDDGTALNDSISSFTVYENEDCSGSVPPSPTPTPTPTPPPPPGLPAEIHIPSGTVYGFERYSSCDPVSEQASSLITNDEVATIGVGACVKFVSGGTIDLQPGFTAWSGSEFHAQIQ